MTTLYETSELRVLEELRACELRTLQLMASDAPLDEVLEAIVLYIERQAEGMLGTILLVEDGKRVRGGVAPSFGPGFIAAFDGEEIGPDRGSCGTAAWRRETVVVEDIGTDPLWQRYRDGVLALGLRACWSVPIFGPDGSVLGTFALYYREPRGPTDAELSLTEHASHLASIAIAGHRTREALHASERQVASIYDNLDDMLFQLHVEGHEVRAFRFDSVNASMLRATDLAAREVIGKRVDELIPPESIAFASARYAEAIESRQTVRWDESWSGVAGTRHGEVAITPVFDDTGRATHLVGAVRDVTARRALEEQMRHLQKMEAVSRLSGGIAHDFNNLLSVILLSATALEHELVDPDQREFVGEVLAAARRGAALTQQFLAISRKQHREPETLDVRAVVTGLEGMLRRLLPASIQLQISSGASLAPVELDRGQLEQVIVNLVVNARDAMPDGGMLCIETSNLDVHGPRAGPAGTIEPGSYVILSVSDTGVGMDHDLQGRIFEPFFTTKTPDRGSGLGLAAVYGIVKQSGGELTVHSELGRGSTFSIYLRQSEVIHPAPTLAAPSVPLAAAEQPAPLHALVVEDEPALRAVFERLLPTLGCRVTIVGSAEEAVDWFSALAPDAHPDVLITDVVLPGESGVSLATRLWRMDPELNVLVVSGYPDGAGTDRAALPPGARFMMKPFTLSDLSTVLDEIAEHSLHATQ